MKRIITLVREFFMNAKDNRASCKIERLKREAVHLIYFCELYQPINGKTGYGIFIGDNLVAIYEVPNEAMLKQVIELRELYVSFWNK